MSRKKANDVFQDCRKDREMGIYSAKKYTKDVMNKEFLNILLRHLAIKKVISKEQYDDFSSWVDFE